MQSSLLAMTFHYICIIVYTQTFTKDDITIYKSINYSIYTIIILYIYIDDDVKHYIFVAFTQHRLAY